MDLKNIFETGKLYLVKPSVMSHHFFVLIGHVSAELWWFIVLPSPNLYLLSTVSWVQGGLVPN